MKTNTMLDLYSHVTPDIQAQAGSVLEQSFSADAPRRKVGGQG